MIIRTLKPEDTDRLFQYFHQLSPESKSRFGPHPFDRETLDVLCAGRYKGYIGYVAEEDGYIIAYTVIKPGYLDFEMPRLARYDISMDLEHDVTIAPSVADKWQSKGIGSQLMTHMLQEFSAQNKKKVILWGGVQATNIKAIRFYQKHGFRTLGEFEYNGMNLDMVKEL